MYVRRNVLLSSLRSRLSVAFGLKRARYSTGVMTRFLLSHTTLTESWPRRQASLTLGSINTAKRIESIEHAVYIN